MSQPLSQRIEARMARHREQYSSALNPSFNEVTDSASNSHGLYYYSQGPSSAPQPSDNVYLSSGEPNNISNAGSNVTVSSALPIITDASLGNNNASNNNNNSLAMQQHSLLSSAPGSSSNAGGRSEIFHHIRTQLCSSIIDNDIQARELNSARSYMASLEREMERAREEARKKDYAYRRAVEEATGQRAAFLESLADTNAACEDLREDAKRREAQISRLEKHLSKACQEKDILQKQYDELKGELSSSLQSAAELEAHLKTVEDGKKMAEDECDRLKKRYKSLSDDYDRIRSENAMIEGLKSQVTKLTTLHQEDSANISNMRSKLDECRNERDNALVECVKLKNEAEDMRTVAARLAEADKMRESLSVELRKCKENLEAQTNKVAKLSQTNAVEKKAVTEIEQRWRAAFVIDISSIKPGYTTGSSQAIIDELPEGDVLNSFTFNSLSKLLPQTSTNMVAKAHVENDYRIAIAKIEELNSALSGERDARLKAENIANSLRRNLDAANDVVERRTVDVQKLQNERAALMQQLEKLKVDVDLAISYQDDCRKIIRSINNGVSTTARNINAENGIDSKGENNSNIVSANGMFLVDGIKELVNALDTISKERELDRQELEVYCSKVASLESSLRKREDEVVMLSEEREQKNKILFTNEQTIATQDNMIKESRKTSADLAKCVTATAVSYLEAQNVIVSLRAEKDISETALTGLLTELRATKDVLATVEAQAANVTSAEINANKDAGEEQCTNLGDKKILAARSKRLTEAVKKMRVVMYVIIALKRLRDSVARDKLCREEWGRNVNRLFGLEAPLGDGYSANNDDILANRSDVFNNTLGAEAAVDNELTMALLSRTSSVGKANALSSSSSGTQRAKNNNALPTAADVMPAGALAYNAAEKIASQIASILRPADAYGVPGVATITPPSYMHNDSYRFSDNVGRNTSVMTSSAVSNGSGITEDRLDSTGVRAKASPTVSNGVNRAVLMKKLVSLIQDTPRQQNAMMSTTVNPSTGVMTMTGSSFVTPEYVSNTARRTQGMNPSKVTTVYSQIGGCNFITVPTIPVRIQILAENYNNYVNKQKIHIDSIDQDKNKTYAILDRVKKELNDKAILAETYQAKLRDLTNSIKEDYVFKTEYEMKINQLTNVQNKLAIEKKRGDDIATDLKQLRTENLSLGNEIAHQTAVATKNEEIIKNLNIECERLTNRIAAKESELLSLKMNYNAALAEKDTEHVSRLATEEAASQLKIQNEEYRKRLDDYVSKYSTTTLLLESEQQKNRELSSSLEKHQQERQRRAVERFDLLLRRGQEEEIVAGQVEDLSAMTRQKDHDGDIGFSAMSTVNITNPSTISQEQLRVSREPINVTSKSQLQNLLLN